MTGQPQNLILNLVSLCPPGTNEMTCEYSSHPVPAWMVLEKGF